MGVGADLLQQFGGRAATRGAGEGAQDLFSQFGGQKQGSYAVGDTPLNPIQEQHPALGWLDRPLIQNLTGGRPEVAKLNLRKWGFEAEEVGPFDFALRRPGGKWYKLDPAGGGLWERFKDVTDVVGGGISTVAQAVGGILGGGAAVAAGVPTSGASALAIPAAAAGGAGIGGAIAETGLTSLGKMTGLDIPLGEQAKAIGTEAAWGAAGELGGRALQKGWRFLRGNPTPIVAGDVASAARYFPKAVRGVPEGGEAALEGVGPALREGQPPAEAPLPEGGGSPFGRDLQVEQEGIPDVVGRFEAPPLEGGEASTAGIRETAEETTARALKTNADEEARRAALRRVIETHEEEVAGLEAGEHARAFGERLREPERLAKLREVSEGWDARQAALKGIAQETTAEITPRKALVETLEATSSEPVEKLVAGGQFLDESEAQRIVRNNKGKTIRLVWESKEGVKERTFKIPEGEGEENAVKGLAKGTGRGVKPGLLRLLDLEDLNDKGLPGFKTPSAKKVYQIAVENEKVYRAKPAKEFDPFTEVEPKEPTKSSWPEESESWEAVRLARQAIESPGRVDPRVLEFPEPLPVTTARLELAKPPKIENVPTPIQEETLQALKAISENRIPNFLDPQISGNLPQQFPKPKIPFSEQIEKASRRMGGGTFKEGEGLLPSSSPGLNPPSMKSERGFQRGKPEVPKNKYGTQIGKEMGPEKEKGLGRGGGRDRSAGTGLPGESVGVPGGLRRAAARARGLERGEGGWRYPGPKEAEWSEGPGVLASLRPWIGLGRGGTVHAGARATLAGLAGASVAGPAAAVIAAAAGLVAPKILAQARRGMPKALDAVAMALERGGVELPDSLSKMTNSLSPRIIWRALLSGSLGYRGQEGP